MILYVLNIFQSYIKNGIVKTCLTFKGLSSSSLPYDLGDFMLQMFLSWIVLLVSRVTLWQLGKSFCCSGVVLIQQNLAVLQKISDHRSLFQNHQIETQRFHEEGLVLFENMGWYRLATGYHFLWAQSSQIFRWLAWWFSTVLWSWELGYLSG